MEIGEEENAADHHAVSDPQSVSAVFSIQDEDNGGGAVGRDFYDDGYEDDDRSINNRIVFDSNKFYGRKDEMETMLNIYTRLCTQSSVPSSKEALVFAESPVVMIKGYSGTGKSGLVYRFLDDLKKHADEGRVKPFLSLSGKYESLRGGADPFSGIADAFSGFCRFLLQEDQHINLARVRRSIKRSLGPEAKGLCAVVPDLQLIIEDTAAGGSEKRELVALGDSSTTTDTAWNRLLYLFQNLLKAICDEHFPVVMFLDDLHWADSASLELIASLLQDKSLRFFMFIGAARADEIGKEHKLNEILDTVELAGKKVERIDLLNLSQEEIGVFVADTLGLGVDAVEPLTKLIYEKTRGNIFFAMQALQELQRLNVLHFSMITFQWEWNLDGVELETGLSKNVGEAVVSKIRSAPRKLQQALKLASYTTSTIDTDTVKCLMLADGCYVSPQELTKLFDVAVLEGLLLNSVGSKNYKFAHDRIQQACYSLVPSGPERERIRLMIGEKLLELSSTVEGEDWMLFVAADHLNSCTQYGQDCLKLARLNLTCGERACGLAAYVPASVFLRLALMSLRKIKGHWEHEYDLSLRLYRVICDTELCLGNFSEGSDIGLELVNNSKSLDDRLPTFLSLAKARGRQQKHAEALQLCETALHDLGGIPKRFHLAHMIKDSLIIKHLFKKYSDYEILVFPKMTDKARLAEVEFIAEGSLRAFHCGDGVKFMFFVFRNLRLTFKYGLCGASGSAFAAYGLFLGGSSGDHQGALRMARLAREALKRTDSKAYAPVTLLTCIFYVESWSFSREKMLRSSKQAHCAGMESGNIEMGFQNWISGNIFAWGTGYPLDPVERKGKQIIEQMELYNVQSTLVLLIECRLPLLHLLGRNETPLEWETIESYGNEGLQNPSGLYRRLCGLLARLELAVFFGNMEVALKMTERLLPLAKQEASYIHSVRRQFFASLTYNGIARKTKSRLLLAKAHALTREMKKISRTKGLNSFHKYLIMRADVMATRKKKSEKVAEAFEHGIGMALKIGYLQDAALGSEIAGEYFLSKGDRTRARLFLCQSLNLYKEWGAVAKVQKMTADKGDLVKMSQYQAIVSIGNLGHISSIDVSESRQTIDLDLLSGTTPRTEIPMMPKERKEEEQGRDRDDVSILTEPSTGPNGYLNNSQHSPASDGDLSGD